MAPTLSESAGVLSGDPQDAMRLGDGRPLDVILHSEHPDAVHYIHEGNRCHPAILGEVNVFFLCAGIFQQSWGNRFLGIYCELLKSEMKFLNFGVLFSMEINRCVHKDGIYLGGTELSFCK